MFYNYDKNNINEYNECDARGACSIAPKISSLQEVIIIFLKQISYYALMLNKFEEDISIISENIIASLSSLVCTTDYTDEELLGLVSKEYALLIKTKRQYLSYCKKNNLECKELKNDILIEPQMTLSSIIAQGEKHFLKKLNKMTVQEKNIYEILLSVLKSLSTNIMRLKDDKIIFNEAELAVVNGLNMLNTAKLSKKKVKSKLKELSKMNDTVVLKRFDALQNNYGKINETIVSHSTREGKAILVSGGSLSDLNKLLEASKSEKIDIYTHGDLLIAHAFDLFKSYENLKGHYGKCNEKCILDFATFPGAILLTSNSSQSLEYVYRGRIFTTEKYKPKGVEMIVNNNFKPLIVSAKSAKGFAKGQTREDELICFDPEKLDSKLTEISEKFTSKEIEKLIILGISNYTRQQEQYFDTLLRLIPQRTFVLSFSYGKSSENVLKINIVKNLPMAYSILSTLFAKIPINSDRISYFLTKCDSTSIAKMISLRETGAKNVYLSQCSPNIINPSVLSTLKNMYGIKTTSTPENDAKLI